MTTPLQLSVDLLAPASSSVPAVSVFPFPLTLGASYTNEFSARYTFTGTGTKTLDLGPFSPSAADLKLLIIFQEVPEETEGGVVSVTIDNAADPAHLISPGGFIIVSNPTAQDTPIIELAWSDDATVRVWAYG